MTFTASGAKLVMPVLTFPVSIGYRPLWSASVTADAVEVTLLPAVVNAIAAGEKGEG